MTSMPRSCGRRRPRRQLGSRSRCARSAQQSPDHVREGEAAAKLDEAEVGRIFREESGRSVAILIGVFGDIDVAEDAVQEAFAVALRKWPLDGLPPNPGGWITTTARNRAIERLRRESRGRQLLGEAAALSPGNDDPGLPEEVGPVQDDRLRLIFTCCNPALSTEAQVALTLRLLGGLSTKEVARAFLLDEPTMAQRLVRAKRKIKAARIPTASRRITNCPAASARCSQLSTSSTTPGRPAHPNLVSARRRSGWRASWRRSCPTSRRWPACWRCCSSPNLVARRARGPTAPSCCSASRTAHDGIGP